MKQKKPAVNDTALIAACGLYCGACYRFLKGRCPGCRENGKASWCRIRSCVLAQGIAHCGACGKADFRGCGIYNNRLGRFFGWLFRSNRPGCLDRIKAIGEAAYAKEMAAQGMMTIRR